MHEHRLHGNQGSLVGSMIVDFHYSAANEVKNYDRIKTS